ncbi:hypothetical protein GCM10007301_30340 [Azorhizobium oxalatiphilum]|uniref:Acyl carrier protein n=1 Tax=Azorhizobium oxalatiphilum TaxID=980631 RepID=A0A917FDE6_9HYPH|nr:acyl carrier protein [Azorhizobium oxalatiphilum]GGF68613.1 hypothetical protein GCM10007301_30340 [Azorhizobium oxalatiphilum]
MTLEEKVFAAFQETFDLAEGTDRGTLVYREFPDWNSIGHMTLVAALETHFDAMLEANDILAMSSFQKAVEIMAKYDVH